MSLIDLCAELDDLGGGRFRHTQHLRPVAYRNAGSLARIASDWQNGDANWPHVVTDAPMLIYTAADGMRRICPTRDPARYFEIGAPYVKPAASWQKVSLGTPTRAGNRLSWSTPQADVNVWMAGHFIKLEIPLKGGWQPPGGQFAFPVGLTGLTRSGNVLLADSVPVMSLRAPVVYDAANTEDTRTIAHQFARVSGQDYVLFTLPDLAGMISPVIDPTFTAQPDATAGKDTVLVSGSAANTNYGDNNRIAISSRNEDPLRRQSLIKFTLTDAPDTFTSATLSLYLEEASADDATFAAYLYPVKRAWVEAQATYNIWSTGNSWQTAGATGANDIDSQIGLHTFASTDSINAFYDFAFTPTTKAALDPYGNGWLIYTDAQGIGISNYRGFTSSDGTTAANRPKLTIEYGTGGKRSFVVFVG